MIIRWWKKPGDMVQRGEVLLEVETDKATMEVEATASGVLQDVRYAEGAVVPILTAVAVIAEAGERVEGGAWRVEGEASTLHARRSTLHEWSLR